MARQFYDGYPKIYDRKREIAENFCDDISNFSGACECEPQKNDDVCRDNHRGEKCRCKDEKHGCECKKDCKDDCKCGDKHGTCECENHADVCESVQNPCCAPVQACSNGILDGIFQNFAVDDIILLGIALLLLHDGTNDTLLLVIIAIVFLEGLT